MAFLPFLTCASREPTLESFADACRTSSRTRILRCSAATPGPPRLKMMMAWERSSQSNLETCPTTLLVRMLPCQIAHRRLGWPCCLLQFRLAMVSHLLSRGSGYGFRMTDDFKLSAQGRGSIQSTRADGTPSSDNNHTTPGPFVSWRLLELLITCGGQQWPPHMPTQMSLVAYSCRCNENIAHVQESCTLTWHVPIFRRGRFAALSCRFQHA